jgi:hypothetical protein
MRKTLGLALAGMMVVGFADPVQAQTKYEAYIEVNSFQGNEYPGINVWVYKQDSQGETSGLRYIKVCLLRATENSFETRSCKKTNSSGEVTWLLYPGYEYQIYVPPTAYHFASNSEPFYP